MKQRAKVLSVLGGAVPILIASAYFYFTSLQSDVLLTGLLIVTGEEAHPFIKDGCLLIRRGQIIAVKEGPACTRFSAREVHHLPGRLAFSGFVNTHVHGGNFAIRGLYKGPSIDWWEKLVFPLELQFVKPETAYHATYLSGRELLRSGVTTVNDMYFFSDQVAEAYRDLGLRAFVSESAGLVPSPSARDSEELRLRSEKLFERWRNHPHITPSIGIHGLYVENAIVRDQLRLAKDNKSLVSVHFLEIPEDRRNFGLPSSEQTKAQQPYSFLHKLGYGERLLAVHGTVADKDEIADFCSRGLSISLNISSNINVRNQIPLAEEMRASGCRLSVGTDGAVTNPSLDFFSELRTLRFFYGKTFSNRELFLMATIGGARALGIQDLVGTLEVEKAADIVILNPGTRFQDVYETIIEATPDHVEQVYVSGVNRIAPSSQETEREKKSVDYLNNWVEGVKRVFASDI